MKESKKYPHGEIPEAGPSRWDPVPDLKNEDAANGKDDDYETEDSEKEGSEDFAEGMDFEGLVEDSKLKPLTPQALAEFKAVQDRAGVIYISRIPPGMRPAKVRHIMSAFGEVGRIYLQQEDSKRAYLRKKFTATKKVHYTEGWIEFKDKRIARSVAQMLNAQPIGGKKGSRWRDDIWTMKYLPKFKWYMLTEQVAHEAAIHRAKLRVELSQSKTEQQEYLKNVELAKVLDKRAAKKKEKGETFQFKPNYQSKKRQLEEEPEIRKKRKEDVQIDSVLSSIF